MNKVQPNFIYVVIPPILGYLMSEICFGYTQDEVQTAKKERDTFDTIIERVVWPTLFLFIGFSWALSKQNAKVGKEAFKGATFLTLDSLYVLFMLLMGLWLMVKLCGKKSDDNMQKARIALGMTTVSGLALIYNVARHAGGALFPLIPVVMWIFMNGQFLNIYWN